MRVGLNATCFNDRPSGANQRFFNIYHALVRRRPDIDFIVYEPVEHRIADWFGGAANVTAQVTPIPSVGRIARLRAGRGYWSSRLRADRLDLFECFHLPLLSAPACPTIFTIHDLRPIHADQSFLARRLSRWVLRDAFARADHVVAVSDAVKAEILAFRPGTMVSTIYNGVDPAAFASPDSATVAAVRERYKLPDSFVLAIGHLEPRKNLGVLVEAIAKLRDAGISVPLAIVGNDGGSRASLVEQIVAGRLEPLITMIEDADDATVRALYAGCTMVAFPSRYEGFGIPILEAMAAGKPLVMSDTDVFRELTLGQGRYFPPGDPAAAAAAIADVWTDPGERARQIISGRERVEAFGFDRLADEVAVLYERLAGATTAKASANRARPTSTEWKRS